jgi:hypothetical protein
MAALRQAVPQLVVLAVEVTEALRQAVPQLVVPGVEVMAALQQEVLRSGVPQRETPVRDLRLLMVTVTVQRLVTAAVDLARPVQEPLAWE